METPVVIDIECFRYRNETWVVKEIAVCGDYIDSITLKPPYSRDKLSANACRAFSWITANIHGMNWNSGDCSYDRLDSFVKGIRLRYPDSIFFAKGLEKCLFLEQLFHQEFMNLDDSSCPKISELILSETVQYHNSTSHTNTQHCARKKVQAYSNWLKCNVINGVYENQLITKFSGISLDNSRQVCCGKAHSFER